MQSVSSNSTLLKPLHARKTVINYHGTESIGKELIEWSHIKQKAKKTLNKLQVKMYLPPTPSLSGSQGWDRGKLSRSGLASPHRMEKLGAAVPCWRMEQPVYGACKALTSATAWTLHRGQWQPGIDKGAFCPLYRGGGVPVTAREGLRAVPPPKPRQSPRYHQQTQQPVPSAQRMEAVGRDIRVSLF